MMRASGGAPDIDTGNDAAGPALGDLDAFAEGTATPITCRVGEHDIALVVVRPRGRPPLAYLDVCPHLFLPLTYRGARVLSADGERLRCSSHSAEFLVADGSGVSGHGLGCALTPVPLRLDEDGIVRLVDPGLSS